MDKPHFIRGLLEEVGTAIDPIKLVRRIPEGLEIEGLRDGIGRMVREYEIQYSISDGVAKVLRGEVATGMDTLRAGQKRGIKFEVVPCDDEDNTLTPTLSRAHTARQAMSADDDVDIRSIGVNAPTVASKNSRASSIPTPARANILPDPSPPQEPGPDAPPGHCTGCHEAFTLPSGAEAEDELYADPDASIPRSRDALVGFACGHIFHLSCLLPKTSASASMIQTLQKNFLEDTNAGYGHMRVWRKVANAHTLRTVIGKGCVVCNSGLEEGGQA
jgi:hypothetical protein